MCVEKQNYVNRKEVYSSYTDFDNDCLNCSVFGLGITIVRLSECREGRSWISWAIRM